MAEIKTYAIPTWLYHYRPLGHRSPDGEWVTDDAIMPGNVRLGDSSNSLLHLYEDERPHGGAVQSK